MKVAEKIKAGNWKDWSHFFSFGLDEYERTHYLWQHGNNVSSPLLSEHNAGEITERLEKAGVDAEATTVGGGLRGAFIFAHLVRVADDEGKPIPANITALEALVKRLDDYPILDEDGYSEKVEAANHRLLCEELNCASNSLQWDYPAFENAAAYNDLAWEILAITEANENHWEDWFPEFDGAVGEALEQLGYARVEAE